MRYLGAATFAAQECAGLKIPGGDFSTSEEQLDGVECAVAGVQGKARRRGIANLFKEEQRSHALLQPCNPPRSALT